MLEVKDKDYRDSDTLWLLIQSVSGTNDVRPDVLELTRDDVQEMLDDFDQEEA